uniref:RxLR effector candidate protein n=1 Tax=Hyaloperonospora arabidopsidis (strain Emoy2) TaxID=559515 RepID=M4BBM3_HYAAE
MSSRSRRVRLPVAKGPTSKKNTRRKSRETQESLMDLLTGLRERMKRLEASQQQWGEEQQHRDQQASVFESSLGQGIVVNRQALDVTPPLAVTPCLSSPATYFGIRQPGYARASENVQMAQAPQQVLPQHFVPPPVHVAPPMQQHQRPVHQQVQVGRVPDARQRKLGVRPFDGKELYQELGSGLLSGRKSFVRQIQFVERACVFPWSDDINVDILGHKLKGMAERYYNE